MDALKTFDKVIYTYNRISTFQKPKYSVCLKYIINQSNAIYGTEVKKSKYFQVGGFDEFLATL